MLKKEKLILFIHGFLGGNNTWGNFENLLSKHEKEVFTSYDVMFFDYPTAALKSPTIQTLARGLRTEINNRYLQYNEIILVCHSMGGLVAKQYLIDEIKIHKPKSLKVKKIIYYATPHLGTQLANYAKLVPNKQIKQMARNSEFIDSINTDNAVYKVEDHVCAKYVIAEDDDVVEKSSAQAYYANSKSEMLLGFGHINCCKPSDDMDDIRYLVLKNFILFEECKEVQQKDFAVSSAVENHSEGGDNVVNKTVINKSVSVGGSNSGIIITGNSNTIHLNKEKVLNKESVANTFKSHYQNHFKTISLLIEDDKKPIDWQLERKKDTLF